MVTDPPLVGTEPSLLDDARRGKPDAFAELYERHRSLALAVARRTLGPSRSWLAEDAVHTAFLDVFAAIRNGAGPTERFQPYLHTAVRRHAARLQRVALLPSSPLGHDVPDAQQTDAVAVDGELGGHSLLEQAFAELPARYRAVLWATEVQGYRPAKAAALLAISPASVYVLRHRGRRRLVSAYLAAYARTAGQACRLALDEVAAQLLAERPAGPLASADLIDGHIAGCAACRDLLRGIDVGAP